ncbi:MAG: helicase-related protein [bacterium]|nr:helicase-related protein [bacterium]
MISATLSNPGTLIHARGRDWVVLPESTDDLLIVRPVGGLDEEVTGILPAIEVVESTAFRLPTRDDLGDFGSGQLLRDAARLSTRSAAGPFRSFGRIAVEPRPYQLVPLMMALKLDPVRLLIADDVGIGKTIEASTIARELLDRGEIRRLAVLCPPHLAEQWQGELAKKFHIEAELVLSSTIQRLERDLPIGVSVFDRYRFTIVSTDFIKTPRRAEDFVLKCPEFVIVDEAHGCTLAGGVGRGRQQRFELLRRISEDKTRHLVLVTATPHSGNEEAFRSLLSLIDEDFAHLPNDLDRAEREGVRRKLARHLVQRRRSDIRHYLETDTAFPERKDKEATYTFSKDHRALFDDILSFARDYVSGQDGARRRRVRYWSALALLRCVSSSPAAAAATLRSRAAVDEAAEEEVDEVGRRSVLDQDDADDVVSLDFSPGSDTEGSAESTRRKLLEFARRAEALSADSDHKLQGAIREIKSLLKEGFQPVVFCRFVDTADYVARQLREELPAKVLVESVTGLLPPAEREARIASLVAERGEYVLVCTDCLSEGINLQQQFNAVLHYDLAWNPTRHEQREGRVDRFGQRKAEVRVVTYYGTDNPIDGVILDVLIRKHKSIKSDLGVAVAVPGSSEQIAEALFEGALFREKSKSDPTQLTLNFIDNLGPKKQDIHAEWESARDREKASRSRFAQHTLSPEAVAAELQSVRSAIGRSEDVARFFQAVLQAATVPVQTMGKAVTVHLSNETPRALRQAIGRDDPFTGRFDLPLEEGDLYLGRTSPVIEGLASWTLDQALDPVARDVRPVAARCGVVSTSAVTIRTTLLLARFRYHLQVARADAETILVEEIVPLACTGPADSPQWLTPEEAEILLSARPERNLVATAIDQQIGILFDALQNFQQALEPVALKRAEAQLAAHERVREATRTKGRVTIQPVLPVDILGAYVLLPRLS